MFGSPITRVLFSVTAIAFFQDLFIWPHKFRTRLLYYSYILVMCSVLSLGPVQASEMGSFEEIFDSFTCYLLPQGVTCYVDSVVQLWYLFILLFSYHYYYHSQSIYVQDNIMNLHSFWGIKTYISMRLMLIANKV